MEDVWGSIPGPVKSHTVLATAGRRFDVSSELCQALSNGDGPRFTFLRNIEGIMKI